MQAVFEKIIEKLNSKKAYFQRFYECEGKSEHDADLNKSTQLAFDDAIEIVKQGDVSDDFCEWKQTSTAKYKTSCGYRLEEYFDTKACYCKQCGKKIKAVE